MTKMFGNLTGDGLEDSGDVLGGGGLFEAGAYDGIVKLAYAGKSQHSGAQSLNVHIDINGREYRETFWVTNKKGENFYADKNDASKKRPLPGFTMADDLCLLTTGMPLSEQPFEEKTVKLWDFEAKKELPTQVPVLTDVIGKPITVGLLREIVNKQQKDSTGTYVDTAETREQNTADKFFHTESRRTVTEVREGIEEAGFYPKWVEKNAGKVRDRVKPVNATAGAPGRPAAAGAPGKTAPKKSLFG